jgi:pectin methylesterase-like acyl-CoA thioesterase
MNTRVLFACLAIAVQSSVAFATDRLVPSQYSSIQSAINAAVDGDRVVLAPGTYNEQMTIDNKSITIASSDGPAVTKIDRVGSSGTIFYVPGGADKAVYFLDEIWPDRVVAGMPLRAIVVPRITGQATTRFEPCSTFDAVVAMLPSTVAQLPAASNEDCDRMVALAEKLPAYVLQLGTDICGIPAALTTLLNG